MSLILLPVHNRGSFVYSNWLLRIHGVHTAQSTFSPSSCFMTSWPRASHFISLHMVHRSSLVFQFVGQMVPDGSCTAQRIVPDAVSVMARVQVPARQSAQMAYRRQHLSGSCPASGGTLRERSLSAQEMWLAQGWDYLLRLQSWDLFFFRISSPFTEFRNIWLSFWTLWQPLKFLK